MSTLTLETAANRLVERLRSCPSDDIVARLAARKGRVESLRTQMANEWAASRASVEQLIEELAGERVRIRLAAHQLLEGLKELAPELEKDAADAIGACAAAKASLAVSAEPSAKLQASVEAEVKDWTAQAGGFIVALLDGKGRLLADAHQGLAEVIPDQLGGELRTREEWVRGLKAEAGEMAGTASDLLNAAYEQWAVRVATASTLAQRAGSEGMSEHAGGMVESATEAVQEAQQPTFNAAQATLELARDTLNTFGGVVAAEVERIGTALEGVDTAVDASTQAGATASRELTESVSRLHVFASRMLP